MVQAIEAGNRQLSVSELVIFARVLSYGRTLDASVSELLDGDDLVRLSTTQAAPLLAVRQILSSPAALNEEPSALRPLRRTEQEKAAERMAERRAAKQLGVHPTELTKTAYLLWGRSLSDERDFQVERRMGEPDEPAVRRALRGRVTRDLVEQIRQKIEANRL